MPSDQERESIKAFLSPSEDLLNDLDRKILELESNLARLKIQKQQLHEKIEPCRALVSTFRRLPDDILSEIFIQCLPQGVYATLSPHDAPILLTHVCNRWRNVAHSTPHLWSSLHIPVHPDSRFNALSEEAMVARDEHVNRWLLRAGSLPLSLSFCSPVDRAIGETSTQDLTRLIKQVPSTSHGNWSDFTCTLWTAFQLSDGEPVFSFDHNILTPLQRVPKLAMEISLRGVPLADAQEVADAFLVLLDLKSNTQLRDLKLVMNRALFNIHTLTSYLPCSKLRTLDLQGICDSRNTPYVWHFIPAKIVALVRKCPNLVVFRVNVTQHLSEPGSRVILPHLKELSYGFDDPRNDGPLQHISHLLMSPQYLSPLFDIGGPNLSSFHWRGRSPGLPIFSTYLGWIGLQLTSLCLDSTFPISQILPLVPGLIQLHMESKKDIFWDELSDTGHDTRAEEEINSQVLQLLTPQVEEEDSTPTSPPSHLCPRLQYLRWEGNVFFSEADLLIFLLQRAHSPRSLSPLKQVHIYFQRQRKATIDIFSECAELIRGGLDLRLIYGEMGERGRSGRSFDPKAALPVDRDREFGW